MRRTGVAARRAVALGVLAIVAVAGCTSSAPGRPAATPTTGTATSAAGGPAPQTTGPVPPTDADHPNVVLVVADDLSWNLVPFMKQVVQMQHQGLTMDHFFTNSPQGTPARATMLTGRYPHNTGVLTDSGTNGGYAAFARSGLQDRTIAVAAHRAGYQTGYFGEYLTGYKPTDDPPPGWDRWAVIDNGFRGYGYTMRLNSSTQKYGRAPADYATDVLADRAVSFIRSAAAAGTPFLAQISTFAPHLPAVPARRDAHDYSTTTYPRTRTFGRAPATPPKWLDFGTLSTAQEAAIDAQYRMRLRAVKAIDLLIARVEGALARAQVAQNTYLVFTSANGYHLGEYRLPPGKKTAFDTDTRVPLIVTGPAVRANRHSGQYASTVDLAPTLARLIGATMPGVVDGLTLDAVWHGVKASVRPPAVLVEHRQGRTLPGDPDGAEAAAGNPPDYLAIRTPTGLFVRYTKTKEREYYDVVSDPDELTNLGPSGKIPLATQRALTALSKCSGFRACRAAAKIAK